MEQKTSTYEHKIIADEIERLKAGVNIFGHAAKIKTYRELLLLCYRYCVNQEGLVPLEQLPQELKDQVWQEAKKDTAGLNKGQCIEISKIVYLISTKL